jgi:hypothetical protein
MFTLCIKRWSNTRRVGLHCFMHIKQLLPISSQTGDRGSWRDEMGTQRGRCADCLPTQCSLVLQVKRHKIYPHVLYLSFLMKEAYTAVVMGVNGANRTSAFLHVTFYTSRYTTRLPTASLPPPPAPSRPHKQTAAPQA